MGLRVLLQALKKAFSIRDRFQVGADGLCVRVRDKVFQEVTFVHIGLVADGTGLADAHGPVRNRINKKTGGEHAALDDERDITGHQTVIPDAGENKGKHMAIHGIHESHTVGPP